MAIEVLCTGCKTRFKVNDKFAGKTGPCPKCKTQITIPEKGPEIKVHAPENFGPKGATGKATLQPIFREERKFSPVIAAGIGGAAVVLLALALIMRFNYPTEKDKTTFPIVFLALGAILLAPPLAYAGYFVLRDDELEPHSGQSLWIRVGICSAVYAAIWGIMAGIFIYLDPGDPTKEIWMIAVIILPMLLIGAGTAFVTFDLEFLKGFFHYGLYLLVTVLLRLIIGLAPLIGPLASNLSN